MKSFKVSCLLAASAYSKSGYTLLDKTVLNGVRAGMV